MAVDVLLGLQWGDEGKGKIVDYLAPNYKMVCRFQGGPNAGHTIIIGDKKFVLHTVPSGIFREGVENVIGNGVVLDPITLCREMDQIRDFVPDLKERLLVARKAHLILPTHRLLDAASEKSKGAAKIGSTLRGIGPTYMDKTGRNGLRVGDIEQEDFKAQYENLKKKHLGLLSIYPEVEFDLASEETKWFDAIEKLKELTKVDCEYHVNEKISQGVDIIAEGAQGSMLDIEYGTYPFVTSSNTITAGVCTGLGIAPHHIRNVIGISKAYCTRVGSGPFPSEIDGHYAAELSRIGHEFGATTGRPRRCGWIDIPQLKYSCMVNGVTHLVLTKIDVMNTFDQVSLANSYTVNGENTQKLPFDLTTNVEANYESHPGWNADLENCNDRKDLPAALESYISKIEEGLNLKIWIMSTGPERNQLIPFG